ncbi:PilZ domain-containing protein [bacterium]|nr:MAG: PilZ domain-containing protein [bacterium]MCL4232755.1 PilZ domain-containing protein [Dehalococcoidia bacterium]
MLAARDEPGEVGSSWLLNHRPFADNHLMEPGVKAGAPVLVIQPGGEPPLQVRGVALTGIGPVLAVRLESPWPGMPGGEVALIAGEPGARIVARGRLLEARASVASIEITAPWKHVDRRRGQRFATELEAEVRSVLGQSRQKGTITDVSLTGMAVVTAAKPGGREVAIVTQAGAYSATLPCELVQASRSGEGVTLHLKFRELTAAQAAFVRNLVAAAQSRLLHERSEAS